MALPQARIGLSTLNTVLRRNIGASAVVSAKAAQTSDPIQKLFLDKLNEYKKNSSKLKEGKLFDTNAETEAKKKFGMENLHRRYGNNMEEFPKFSFEN